MGATEVNPKVKFGKILVIHGDDWQVRIFSSASQPRHPERTYWVLSEGAYGNEHLELRTETEIDALLAAGAKSSFSPTPRTLEDALRSANLDRDMNYYSIGPRKRTTIKDI